MNAYEHIEKYLAGKLSGTALAEFEAAMKSDESLRQMVDNYDGIKKLSEGILEMELLKEVKKVRAQDAKVKPLKPRRNYLLVGSVAALVVLGLAYLLFNNMGDDLEKEQILASVYEAPDNPNIVKSAEPEIGTEPSLDSARELLSLNRFEEAAKMLKVLIVEAPNVADIEEKEWLLAHSLLRLKKYAQAKIHFNKQSLYNSTCLIAQCDFGMDEISEEQLRRLCPEG